MTYALTRLYGGLHGFKPEDVDQVISCDLLPKLVKAGGLLRYITVQISASGGIGSLSIYNDREATVSGKHIAKDWAATAPSMIGTQVPIQIEGEVCSTIDSRDEVETGSFAMLRIYRTAATRDQIDAAIAMEAQDEIASVGGFLRGLYIKLADTRCMAVSVCRDRDSEQQLLERVSAMRSVTGSRVARVFPHYPERTIKTRVMSVYAAPSLTTALPARASAQV